MYGTTGQSKRKSRCLVITIQWDWWFPMSAVSLWAIVQRADIIQGGYSNDNQSAFSANCILSAPLQTESLHTSGETCPPTMCTTPSYGDPHLLSSSESLLPQPHRDLQWDSQSGLWQMFQTRPWYGYGVGPIPPYWDNAYLPSPRRTAEYSDQLVMHVHNKLMCSILESFEAGTTHTL